MLYYVLHLRSLRTPQLPKMEIQKGGRGLVKIVKLLFNLFFIIGVSVIVPCISSNLRASEPPTNGGPKGAAFGEILKSTFFNIFFLTLRV